MINQFFFSFLFSFLFSQSLRLFYILPSGPYREAPRIRTAVTVITTVIQSSHLWMRRDRSHRKVEKDKLESNEEGVCLSVTTLVEGSACASVRSLCQKSASAAVRAL